LVPMHQNSGALSRWPTDFLFQQTWALETVLFLFFHIYLGILDLTFLTKHYQHEKGFNNKISINKSIGAPYMEIWRYGDISLVPRHQNSVVRLII